MFEPLRPISMIQIGVFEGADLVWCFQNILAHSDSRAIAIDPWLPTTKLSKEFMEEVHQRAVHNLGPWFRKVTIRRALSQNILNALKPNSYDLIVIDGDHTDEAVFEDACTSLRLLKAGGIMVFDDVRNRIPKKNHVLQGIEMFLKGHEKDVELCWMHRYADCYRKV